MDDPTIESHEEIEAAFEPGKRLLKKLPESIQSRRAAANLGTAEAYAHEAYERIEARAASGKG